MHTCEAICRNSALNPGAAALVEGRLEITWGQLADRVQRLAAGIRKLGCKAEDRVIVLSANSARYIEASYAVQWLGAIVVPLSTRWTAAEIGFAIEDSAAHIVIVDDANLALIDQLEGALRDSLTLIYSGHDTAPAAAHEYEALIDDSEPVARAEIAADAIASIFYTGGTTGRSKGVMLTHANHVSHSIAMIAEAGLSPSVRYLHTAPMFHIADSLFTHIISLLGATHVVLGGFEPRQFADAVQRYEITDTILVPTMIQMVLGKDDCADRAFSKLQRLFYGASPMPAALLQQVIERFPTLHLTQLYGQTESSPVLTILPPEWHGLDPRRAAKSRSAGRAMMGTEVRIVDPDDQPLPVGQIGEIVARGPQVMRGYWKRSEETAAALRQGWLHTGDAGYVDEQGFVFVSDRIKDMIITGGENVYSVEVEQAIYQLDGVAQCCVIGLPHEKWGEAVHAIVVPKPGVELLPAAVAEHCANLLADYKRPRSVAIRHEALPLSGAGKILKRELRAQHSASASGC